METRLDVNVKAKPETATIATKTDPKTAATQTEPQPFVDHAFKANMRSAIDYIFLALVIGANDAVKSRISVGDYAWPVCFAVAALYFKFRDTLNPLRDQAGIYQHCLYATKQHLQKQQTSEETPALRQRTSAFKKKPM